MADAYNHRLGLNVPGTTDYAGKDVSPVVYSQIMTVQDFFFYDQPGVAGARTTVPRRPVVNIQGSTFLTLDNYTVYTFMIEITSLNQVLKYMLDAGQNLTFNFPFLVDQVQFFCISVDPNYMPDQRGIGMRGSSMWLSGMGTARPLSAPLDANQNFSIAEGHDQNSGYVILNASNLPYHTTTAYRPPTGPIRNWVESALFTNPNPFIIDYKTNSAAQKRAGIQDNFQSGFEPRFTPFNHLSVTNPVGGGSFIIEIFGSDDRSLRENDVFVPAGPSAVNLAYDFCTAVGRIGGAGGLTAANNGAIMYGTQATAIWDFGFTPQNVIVHPQNG